MSAHLFMISLVTVQLTATSLLASDLLGKQVFPKAEFQLLRDDQPVPDSHLNGLPYVVQAVDGDWLWVGDRAPGWVQSHHIIPLDQAYDYYTSLISQQPERAAWRNLRAIVSSEQGHFEKAIDDYTEAIDVNPQLASAYRNRGVLQARQNRNEAAIADYTRALALHPQYGRALFNRGNAWGRQGECESALEDFNAAIKIDPSFATAWYGRGLAHEKLGRYQKAIEDYQEAIRLEPRHASAHNNLAWILSTCPDDAIRNSALAIEHARQACQLTAYERANHLGTLAAAHAEAGEFDNAYDLQKQSLALTTSGLERLPSEKRLNLYRLHQPFRSDFFSTDIRQTSGTFLLQK